MKSCSAALAILLVNAGLPQAASLTVDSQNGGQFDGTWLYTRDVSDGTTTAIQIAGSSMSYLSKEGQLIVFAAGWWTVNPYAAPDENGLFHVTTRIVDTAINGGPVYEEQVMEITVRMDGPNRAEIWAAGETERRGILERAECAIGVSYTDRSASPPEGCKWQEIRGLGFDGLAGECAWYEDWADNWETMSRDADGNPYPAACLLSVPSSFPD
jgi:hypothetical protein